MGTSASFALARKFAACLLAVLLSFTLLPASALAQEEAEQPQDTVDPQAGEPQEAGPDQDDAGSGSAPAASPAEGGTLASALVGTPTAFVNSDVALDGEPIIGSFTVDGLTFAVTEGSNVELVGVSPDRQQVASSQEGDGSPVAPMLASGPDGSALVLPESIPYEGVDYAVTSIGAYAFYLSGVTAVELPATVTDVDDRAFRSSDVAAVEVTDGNPSYSSFDGALYDAAQLSLLLIPEGKQGTVLLPKRAEVADAGKFSHCSLASAIAVEEGSAAFASENGLLYDASLTTLLRVPAGATDIVIRDGCTAIAAGALEACASLVTITAPASVTSISPDVFTSVPTVSLPAVAVVADDPGASTGATVEPSEQAGSTPASSPASTQLTAMVALSSADDDLPEVDPAAIKIVFLDDLDDAAWEVAGFIQREAMTAEEETLPIASGQDAATYAACSIYINANGGVMEGFHNCSGGVAILQLSSIVNFNINPRSAAVDWNNSGTLYSRKAYRKGYSFVSWTGTATLTRTSPSYGYSYGSHSFTTNWSKNTYPITYDLDGGTLEASNPSSYAVDTPSFILANPVKKGYRFTGWQGTYTGDSSTGNNRYLDGISTTSGQQIAIDDPLNVVIATNSETGGRKYTATWERVDFNLGFDVDSEPGDEDYPGIEKPDETVNVESGPTVIEDPKRPGYVFQGWVIPNTEGTEAIDQDLVYRDETDGKWYVDASKLPDYANDEGRVELTARWTSVISVDVPSAVTFYADVVTEGQESREGAASSAFGQNKVASQSQVDLRIVGLESTAVATEGSTLGADSILKKASSATPSSSTQKLFSLYPTDKALTPDDLQDPDAVSTTKPSGAVDFALDDLLLEKSFAADSFTIPAGETLNLGYRLNLSETGTELDYDTLSTLDEGTSASIANISYCFAVNHCLATGSINDDIYIEYGNKIYGTGDILHAAECISELGEASPCYALYDQIMRAQGVPSQGLLPSDARAKVYAKYSGPEATANQPNCDRAGYVRLLLIGLNHDAVELSVTQDQAYDGTKESTQVSKRAGFTFQFMDSIFSGRMKVSDGTNMGGWRDSDMRLTALSTTGSVYQSLAIASYAKPVYKFTNNYYGTKSTATSFVHWSNLLTATQDVLFLPSYPELWNTLYGNASEFLPSGYCGWINFEGYQYGYWDDVCGIRRQHPDAPTVMFGTDALSKRSNSGVLQTWWMRDAYYNNNTTYYCNKSGAADSNAVLVPTTVCGIAPAFCL